MSAFSDLLQLTNPPIWWTVTFGGTRRSDGVKVRWYGTKAHNHRFVLDGRVEHARDIWVSGSEVEWTRAIARSESGDADRSFFSTGSAGGGEHKWRCRPDALMLEELDGVDLDQEFLLTGWGPAKLDGSVFDLAEGDVPVRGSIKGDRLLENGVMEVTYVDDGIDLDQAHQRNKFGGYDTGHVTFCPGGGDDQVGLWLFRITPAFDIDGSAPAFPGFTAELIFIAEEIPGPQITSDAILMLSGPPTSIPSSSWGLIMGPNAVLTFVAKAERFPTSFTVPRFGWVYVSVAIEPDGVTGAVYAGTGRAAGSVGLVASFTLAAPLSPAVGVPQITFSNPFIGPNFITSGDPWGMLLAEARTHDRPLTQVEINQRRARTWVPTETVRPSHLYRFAGSNYLVAVDEDGGVDLFAGAEIISVERAPTGDGTLPDSGDNDTVGRTIPGLYGLRVNVPAIDVSRAFDSKLVAQGPIAQVHQARSRATPFSLDKVFDGVVDFVSGMVSIIIISDIIGQEDLTFFGFLEPDGDPALGGLLGQFIEITNTTVPDPFGEFQIVDISDDGREMSLDTFFIGPQPNEDNDATVRTPIAGSNKFSGEVLLDTGQVVVNRGSLVNVGLTTFTASGFQGDAVGEEESLSGLFQAVLREAGFAGTITEKPTFLNVSPAGEYLPLGGSESTRVLLNRFMTPNWWYYEATDDSYITGGFTLPGTPVVEIGEGDLITVEEIERRRPWRSVAVRYEVNDSQQDKSGLAGTVPEKNADRWASPGPTVTRDNPSGIPGATDPPDPILTAAFDRDGAELILDRVSIVFEDLIWHRVPCSSFRSYLTNPGDTARFTTLDAARGWEDGHSLVVSSMKFSTANTITYEGYGLPEE